MGNFGNSLLVMVIGLAIVFLGLIIIVFLCQLMSAVVRNMEKKSEPVAAKPAAPAPAPVEKVEAVVVDDDDEIAAVIAAVVTAMGSNAEPKGSFYVRSVRRVNAWSKAGREALLASKNI